MDENSIKSQNISAASQDTGSNDPDDSPHSPQVFDITADLDIAPVKDDETATPDTPASTNEQALKSLAAMPKISPVSASPAISVSPSLAVVENRVAPPNPTTKTVLSTETNVGIAPSTIAASTKERLTSTSNVDPAKQAAVPLDSPDIKPIRTYESDVADLMSHTHVSTASIAIAENKKNSQEEKIVTHDHREPFETSHAVKNLLLTLLSLILLGGGVFGAYYLYLRSPLAPVEVTPAVSADLPSATSLVTSDSVGIVPIDGLNGTAVISRVQAEIAKPQPANSVREIVPVITQNGVDIRVGATDILKTLNIAAPDILARSLKDAWMLGVYADADDQKDIFVVATNDFFQNSFAGMLQWESRMPDDLTPYLAVSPIVSSTAIQALPVVATSTVASTSSKISTSKKAATTTTAAASTTVVVQTVPVVVLRGRFVNKIIDNKDVREYLTADGRVSFLYSFVDSRTLVLTDNESTLSEILGRLEKQSYLR